MSAVHYKDAPKASFLDLPYAVRTRIYDLLLIRSNCTILLNHNSSAYLTLQARDSARNCSPGRSQDNNWNCSNIWQATNCTCFPIQTALLLACRKINQEATRVLYGQNKFRIRDEDAGGLLPLRTLSDLAVSCLSFLTVELNSSFPYNVDRDPRSRNLGHACHFSLRSGRSSKPDGVESSPVDGQNLQDWWIFAQRLASLIPKNQLSLVLRCGTEDPDTAEIAASGLDGISQLNACSIMFTTYRNPELRQLAQVAAKNATRRRNAKFHPFARLPEELMIRVLEHTDLVAPRDILFNNYGPRTDYIACPICVSYREVCTHPHHIAGFSSSCTCWTLPVALFRVNRWFRKESRRVFLARNTFIFKTDSPDTSSGMSSHDPRDYLYPDINRTFGRSSVQHLRSIRMVIPPNIGGNNAIEWRRLLTQLHCVLHPEKLHVSLEFPFQYFFSWHEAKTTGSWTVQSVKSRDVVKTLKTLVNLRSVSVYLDERYFLGDMVACQSEEEELERLIGSISTNGRNRPDWSFFESTLQCKHS